MFVKVFIIFIFSAVCSTVASSVNLEECIKTTGIKVTPEILKHFYEANKGGHFDINSIPEEMLCLPKCVLEKKGVIDSASGKVVIDKLKDDPMVERIPDKKAFLECMENITSVATCEDMKKILDCRVMNQN